jgi:TM2 domain-containing membrane protein YozV
MSNGKQFEPHQIPTIRDMMIRADDSKFLALQAANFKDPTLMLIVSLLAGTLGIDRFLVGDTGMGIGKLLTCGGLGIWAIVDWFLIMGRAKEKNMQQMMQILA